MTTLILIFMTVVSYLQFAHASELGHEGAAFGWFSACVLFVAVLVFGYARRVLA